MNGDGIELRKQVGEIISRVSATMPDVEFLKSGVVREHGSWVVRIVVDRAGGVSTELCESVSRMVAHGLDALGEDAPDYRLEVESAGLDRPLLTPAHFRRFAGKQAKIVTSQPLARRVEFTGSIVTADDESVVIDDPHAGATSVPLAIIKNARLVYDARADLKKSHRT